MRMFKVVVNGTEYEVAVDEIKGEAGSTPTPQVATTAAKKPAAAPAAKPAPAPAPSPTPSGGGDGGEGTMVVAQMPGTVEDIDVNVGDQVTRGKKLLVLEAMKMKNQIVAPQDGVVKEISVTSGALVSTGDVLVVLG